MDQAKIKNTKNSKKTAKKDTKAKGDGAYVEVLYQRLGDKWFAFSQVDGEMFFAEVPESAIQDGEIAAGDLSENGRISEKEAA